MNNVHWKFLLVGLVLGVALFTAAPQANAHWWGTYTPEPWGCCGTTVGYAPYSYASYSYEPYAYTTSNWYLGWRHGPVRRALFGPYRWYWAGYSTVGWDNCCAVTEPCCGGSSVTPAMPLTPAQPTQPTPAPTRAPAAQPPASPQPAPAAGFEPAPRTTQVTPPDASGVLSVWVPYDATVTVNGHETKSKGSHRQFISYGLKPGFSYKYVVHATVVRNGQTQEDTQTVVLKAGDVSAVAFGFNSLPAEELASR